MKSFSSFTPLLVGLALAACGPGDGESDSGSTPDDDAAESTGGALSTEGAGGTGTGGTMVDGAGGNPDEQPSDEVVPHFRVDVISMVFNFATPSMNPFWLGGEAIPFDPACEVLEVGACRVSRCPDTPSEPATEEPDAGTVMGVFSTEEGELTATAEPNALGNYSFTDFAPDGNLTGGESGVVTGSGAEVPAFSVDVQIPLLLLNTSPNLVGGDIMASREEDLVLTWDRGTSGVVYFVQPSFVADEEGFNTGLNCRFPSELGQGTIDQEILAFFPSGSSLITFTLASHTVTAGEMRVEVRTALPTTNPAKDAGVRILVN